MYAQYRPREHPFAGACHTAWRGQPRPGPPARPARACARRGLDAERRPMARQTPGVAVVTDHHIDPERTQFAAFKALPRDPVIRMIHLVPFRDTAAYPADHPLPPPDRSGPAASAN